MSRFLTCRCGNRWESQGRPGSATKCPACRKSVWVPVRPAGAASVPQSSSGTARAGKLGRLATLELAEVAASRWCARCQAAGTARGGRYARATVQIDIVGGLGGFPLDVCGKHHEAALAFFGTSSVRVTERYAA